MRKYSGGCLYTEFMVANRQKGSAELILPPRLFTSEPQAQISPVAYFSPPTETYFFR